MKKIKDIRLAIRASRDKVYTSAGDRVDIIDFETTKHGHLIYGHVLRGDRKINHYWHLDGSFKNSRPSNLDLFIKTENHVQ